MSGSPPSPTRNRKLCVVGFRAVGKSAVTFQFCEDRFVDTYSPTIETSFRKSVKNVPVEIVDTAGMDEYSLFQPQHAIGVDGYILVYAVTARSSFEILKTINDKILNAHGSDKVPRVLVGNKTDLEVERQVSSAEGNALASEWGAPFIECSARTGKGVQEAFEACVAEIMRKEGGWEEKKKGRCVVM
uniref:Rheb n=1 Tax=Andalucia godoyi TaxID=505711 RepID=A0A2R4IKW3_ANDGO|nr:Rheb [Andalucia godoyi]|eukprot:ANDGO_06712.mRNA.1 GTP-binding protein Rheb homolog